jgi:transcriptional regulator with XRE-family HTH domain
MGKIEDLSERVRRLRKEAGFTQAALATQAELSIQMIKDIEAGRRGGSVETLSKLSSAFGISIQELATGGATVKANILTIPASETLRKYLNIPDWLVERAQNHGPKDDVWDLVKIAFDGVEAQQKKKQANDPKKHLG